MRQNTRRSCQGSLFASFFRYAGMGNGSNARFGNADETKEERIMKRMLACLMAAMLLLGIGVYVLAESPLHRYENTWMRDQFLDEAAAWVLDYDGEITRWKYDAQEPEHIGNVQVVTEEMFQDYQQPYSALPAAIQAAIDETVTQLAPDGDTLYVINRFAGKIGTVDDTGVHWGASFDPAPLFNTEGWERASLGKTVVDHRLYILLEDDGNAPCVVEIDLKTGAARTFDAHGCLRLSRYNPGKLLLSAEEGAGFALYSLDITTGSRTLLQSNLPGGEALCYDARTDTVFVGNNSGIYASVSGGEFELKMNLPTTYLYGAGVITKTGRLAFFSEGVWVLNVPGNAAEKPRLNALLTGDDPRLFSLFASRYPGLLLNVQHESELTAALASDRIRGGDEDTDVFSLKADTAFTQYKRKDYAAPLQNAEILDSVNRMYPTMARLLKNDQGQVVAYPQDVMVQGSWAVNPAQWQKYFGNEPYPATWTEFFHRMAEFEALESNDKDLFLTYWEYPYMLEQVLNGYVIQHSYEGGQVDFSDPALLEALQALEKVNQQLLRRGISSYDEGEIFFDSEIIGEHSIFSPGMQYSSNSANLGMKNELPPFVFVKGETPVYRGTMRVMVMNPLSHHREEAEQFISILAAKEYKPTHYYLLHADAVEPFQEKPYNFTQEDIAAWQETVGRVNFGDQSPLLSDAFTQQMSNLVARYAEGQMDAGTLLQKLNETARMVEMETE